MYTYNIKACAVRDLEIFGRDSQEFNLAIGWNKGLQ